MPPTDSGPVPLGAYRNWPGIDEPGHHHVSTDGLRAVAKRLQAHLNELLTAHEGLRSAGPSDFGAWDAAQAFYSSYATGHASLMDQHSRVLHALMDMIKKLHRVAHVHDETEAGLERRIAAIDKRLHVNPTVLSGHGDPPVMPHTSNPNVADALNPRRGN